MRLLRRQSLVVWYGLEGFISLPSSPSSLPAAWLREVSNISSAEPSCLGASQLWTEMGAKINFTEDVGILYFVPGTRKDRFWYQEWGLCCDATYSCRSKAFGAASLEKSGRFGDTSWRSSSDTLQAELVGRFWLELRKSSAQLCLFFPFRVDVFTQCLCMWAVFN